MVLIRAPCKIRVPNGVCSDYGQLTVHDEKLAGKPGLNGSKFRSKHSFVLCSDCWGSRALCAGTLAVLTKGDFLGDCKEEEGICSQP